MLGWVRAFENNSTNVSFTQVRVSEPEPKYACLAITIS